MTSGQPYENCLQALKDRLPGGRFERPKPPSSRIDERLAAILSLVDNTTLAWLGHQQILVNAVLMSALSKPLGGLQFHFARRAIFEDKEFFGRAFSSPDSLDYHNARNLVDVDSGKVVLIDGPGGLWDWQSHVFSEFVELLGDSPQPNPEREDVDDMESIPSIPLPNDNYDDFIEVTQCEVPAHVGNGLETEPSLSNETIDDLCEVAYPQWPERADDERKTDQEVVNSDLLLPKPAPVHPDELSTASGSRATADSLSYAQQSTDASDVSSGRTLADFGISFQHLSAVNELAMEMKLAQVHNASFPNELRATVEDPILREAPQVTHATSPAEALERLVQELASRQSAMADTVHLNDSEARASAHDSMPDTSSVIADADPQHDVKVDESPEGRDGEDHTKKQPDEDTFQHGSDSDSDSGPPDYPDAPSAIVVASSALPRSADGDGNSTENGSTHGATMEHPPDHGSIDVLRSESLPDLAATPVTLPSNFDGIVQFDDDFVMHENSDDAPDIQASLVDGLSSNAAAELRAPQLLVPTSISAVRAGKRKVGHDDGLYQLREEEMDDLTQPTPPPIYDDETVETAPFDNATANAHSYGVLAVQTTGRRPSASEDRVISRRSGFDASPAPLGTVSPARHDVGGRTRSRTPCTCSICVRSALSQDGGVERYLARVSAGRLSSSVPPTSASPILLLSSPGVGRSQTVDLSSLSSSERQNLYNVVSEWLSALKNHGLLLPQAATFPRTDVNDTHKPAPAESQTDKVPGVQSGAQKTPTVDRAAVTGDVEHGEDYTAQPSGGLLPAISLNDRSSSSDEQTKTRGNSDSPAMDSGQDDSQWEDVRFTEPSPKTPLPLAAPRPSPASGARPVSPIHCFGCKHRMCDGVFCTAGAPLAQVRQHKRRLQTQGWKDGRVRPRFSSSGFRSAWRPPHTHVLSPRSSARPWKKTEYPRYVLLVTIKQEDEEPSTFDSQQISDDLHHRLTASTIPTSVPHSATPGQGHAQSSVQASDASNDSSTSTAPATHRRRHAA